MGYASVSVHRELLKDRGRLYASELAIAEVVRPGDVVVDVGTGTGLLAFLACKAGATRVHAIERTSIIEVARRLAERNGLEGRVRFYHADARDLELPERADVLVCDWLGPMAFDGGMLLDLICARDRFLKPGGRMVPDRVRVSLAPFESESAWSSVGFWRRPVCGLDFSAVADMAASVAETARLEGASLLAPPAVVRHLDPRSVSEFAFASGAEFEVRRDGTLHGFAGFHTARMSPGVTLTNEPGGAAPAGGEGSPVQVLDRACRVFLLAEPLPLRRDDRVRVSIRSRMVQGGPLWVWEGEHLGAGGRRARFRHDSLQGVPICREDLEPVPSGAA